MTLCRSVVRNLVPNVPYVVLDSMLLEKSPEFILKAHALVVIFLLRKIIKNILQRALTYRERSVTALPLKCGKLVPFGLQPP